MKKLCYISSPYTEGDQLSNARDAFAAVLERISSDVIPLSPLTMCMMQIYYPLTHAEWMAYDLELLSKCDCMLVLGEKGMVERSKGVQAEIAFALERGIPITYELN
jgi:hypothetical protein